MPVFYRPENQPDIAHANLDKITLSIKRAYSIRFENMDAYNRFKSALGGTDVFSRKGGHQSSSFTIKGGGELGKRWLFHGSTLSFKLGMGGSANFTGVLTLMLNPSRYLNHHIHAHGGIFSGGDPEWFFSTYLLRLTPEAALERFLDLPETALGLDGGDNIIPARLYRSARPVMNIFNLYLDQALAFIREQIFQTLNETQRPNSFEFNDPMQAWFVPYAEIYWEYSVSNAIAFVNGLRNFLLPAFSVTEVAEYPICSRCSNVDDTELALPFRRWTVNQNAPSLTMNLGSKDIDLVVYAKDVDRVRFEVRYKSNLKSLISRLRRASFPEDVRTIGLLLQPAIENAHSRLRNVFAAMPDLDFSERCDFQIFVEFLSDLATACTHIPQGNGLQNIMGLLASNGSIEAMRDSQEDVVCRQLMERDIVHLQQSTRNPRTGNRRYCLNPRYTNSLAYMFSGLVVSQ